MAWSHAGKKTIKHLFQNGQLLSPAGYTKLADLPLEDLLPRPPPPPAGGAASAAASAAAPSPRHERKQRPSGPRQLDHIATEQLRRLHAADPGVHTKAALAARFGVSFEVVARILRSRWRP
eukprot:TRINITY_DN3501_c0_g1_i2.p2 TRINITY_DN3501_c0_g1~~TRINITY_DN3501_c0_g1_i2.p2  ORF type:complete len:121 (-),score=18.81 TRINITY_DN3501_c0_g1_i2:71-433(-)